MELLVPSTLGWRMGAVRGSHGEGRRGGGARQGRAVADGASHGRRKATELCEVEAGGSRRVEAGSSRLGEAEGGE
jgi:hypothetical protein